MAAKQNSLASLAEKFNTEVPAGYVAGRGRGAMGFSEPPPDYVPRGRGRGAAAVAQSEGGGAGPSSARGGPARHVQPSAEFTLREDERKDTAVDFSKTTDFEERALTFDRKEAGYEVEPFNLDAERESGRFDEDFNYVAKRARRARDADDADDADVADDATDAYLRSVDDLKESDEKVAKRRRAAQLAAERMASAEAEQDAIDVPALKAVCARILEPGETVLRALRRLGGAPKQPRGAAAGRGAGEATAGRGTKAPAGDKARFDELTDAASKLMASGHVGIYSDTREALAAGAAHADQRAVFGGGGASGGGGGAQGGSGEAQGGSGEASEYVLDEQSGFYLNRSTGFFFDPSSQLHWDPRAQPPVYYYYDAAARAYVEWQSPAGSAAPAEAS